ncbi:MAG: NACHT domain-containing protein [Chloroflexi bacterium]|nr:NACHT domain-containing protein [Chloroflexota bacterium]
MVSETTKRDRGKGAQSQSEKKEPDRVKESEATKDEKDGETNPSLTKSVTFFPDKTLSCYMRFSPLLHHPQNKQPTTSGLVLTGEPGAGKTVALRHLAATYAMQSAEPDSPIPIYLPLNQYDGQESISAFISSSLSEKHLPLSFSQLAKHLEDILPHHRWLLLLDGFNEIGESRQDTIRHRQAFLRTLQTFVRDYQVEVVISSRENAIPDIKDFQIVNLRPLDQLGIEQCLYLYAPEYAPAILQELEKQPSLRHMVANPFRAKAIAQIYRPNSNLPTTPVSLFAQLTSHLVHRETTRCQAIGSYFPPIEIWKNTVLQTAVSMNRNHTTTSTLPTSEEEQKHLNFAAQCGLLLSMPNQVKFIHHQLQDFFAALWFESRNPRRKPEKRASRRDLAR